MSDREFRFRHPVDVRFKDLDIGGHAHHSHALVYFEEARAAYWRDVVGRPGADLDAIGYVLAEMSLRWHRRVFYPQRLDVAAAVTLLGRKHFVMAYEARAPDGERLVSGMSTQVMFDYASSTATRIPGDVRGAIETFDGPFGARGRREET